MKMMIQVKKSITQLDKSGVHLTQGQKSKLARAYKKNEGVTIRLANSALTSNDVLTVPSNTVKKLAKHKNAGKGIEITIAKINIRKQSGSGNFSAVLPALRAVAPTVAETLGLSALAGAASEGASQKLRKYLEVNYFKFQMTNSLCLQRCLIF